MPNKNVPPHVRRFRNANPELWQAQKRAAAEQSVPEAPKKKRVRQLASEKRADREREEERRVAQEAEERRLDGERETEWQNAVEAWERGAEQRRLADEAQAEERRRQEEIERGLLPVDEINDSKILLSVRSPSPIPFDSCIILQRYSTRFQFKRNADEAAEKALRIAAPYYYLCHRSKVPTNPIDLRSLILDRSNAGAGFKSTYSWKRSTVFVRALEELRAVSKRNTLLLIFGVDGFMTDIEHWKDLQNRNQGPEFQICFWLSKYGGFSPMFRLRDLVNDYYINDSMIGYIRRRWAALKHYRDKDWMQDPSEWHLQYGKLDTRNRNSLNGVSTLETEMLRLKTSANSQGQV